MGVVISPGDLRGDAKSEALAGGALILAWCGDAIGDKFLEAEAGVTVTHIDSYTIDDRFFEAARLDAEESQKRREERGRDREPREQRGAPEESSEATSEGQASASPESAAPPTSIGSEEGDEGGDRDEGDEGEEGDEDLEAAEGMDLDGPRPVFKIEWRLRVVHEARCDKGARVLDLDIAFEGFCAEQTHLLREEASGGAVALRRTDGERPREHPEAALLIHDAESEICLVTQAPPFVPQRMDLTGQA